ncbi:MAG: T9SS type A sorting domain-containing protein [Ignavibacteria bacterium]|nr:T9SS type A sorting domain-containing protein [Ignavibacteria bacterium]
MLAYDNRGWMTKVPFGDSVYYELGALTTGSAANPPPARLALHGLYPDPVPAGGVATLDWMAEPGASTDIAVTDVLGRTRLRLLRVAGPSAVQSARLDLSRLGPGVYVLTISSRAAAVSKTFVKL